MIVFSKHFCDVIALLFAGNSLKLPCLTFALFNIYTRACMQPHSTLKYSVQLLGERRTKEGLLTVSRKWTLTWRYKRTNIYSYTQPPLYFALTSTGT